MHAFRYDGHGLQRLDDATTPNPPKGWSLVRVDTALATHAELHIDRTRPGAAQIPGSAFVGTVLQQTNNNNPDTDNTTKLHKNQHHKNQQQSQQNPPNHRRVVADPIIPCRACERCRRGLAQHCLARGELGVNGLDGCWAEYVTLPTDALIDVPSNIPDSAAVLVHDVARVIHLDRLLPTSPNLFVSVIGSGYQAIVAAAVLNTTRTKARLLTNDPRTLDHASRLSLRHRPLADAGLRADQDAILLMQAGDDDTNRAIDMIAPRGVLALFKPQHARTLNTETIIAHELRVYGISLGPIRSAIDWLAKEPTRFEGLLPDLRPANADLQTALAPPGSGALLRWAATKTRNAVTTS